MARSHMIHRRACAVAGLVALAVAPSCGDGATPPPAGPRRLTLLYTNDEHSHLVGFAPEVDDFPAPTTAGTGAIVGGVARRQVLLTRERAAAAAAHTDTVTVSAGDVAMGTLAQVEFARSAPDYTLLKSLGYDVACIGNHEFDYGPAALAQAITAASAHGGAPQLVASNLHFDPVDPADDTLAALYGDGREAKPIKRYHVVTTPSGLRVGFFGVLGPQAAYYAPFKKPVRASGNLDEEADTAAVRPKLYADLQPVVDQLRTVEKVDLVVALSHSGVDLTNPALGDDQAIAAHVAGIDVIVSGHSHTVVPEPLRVANATTGRDVIVVQAGAYGAWLGRLALTVDAASKVSYDAAASKLLAVDDRTVPDPAAAARVATVIEGIEAGGKPSFLEAAVSRIAGMPVAHVPGHTGDLYFYKLGSTMFDVIGHRPFVETNLLDLAADAQLAAVSAALPDDLPDFSIEAAGVVRGDLARGRTGAITLADAFGTFPLGASTADGTVGYPLVHSRLFLAEVRAALEVGVSYGLTSDSFFLGASGLRVTVDTTLPAFDAKAGLMNPKNGRVVKIEWDSKRRVGAEQYDTVLFDRNATPPTGKFGWFDKFHLATNLYIAAFASAGGVTLKSASGAIIEVNDAIVHRGDGSEVKEYEAVAAWVKALSDANGGQLPRRYDEGAPEGKLPRRHLCTGPLCGK